MPFAAPEYLPLLLVVVPLGWALWRDQLWREGALRQLGEPGVVSWLLATVSLRRQRWKKICLGGGVVCALVALARPQWGKESRVVQRQGVDLVVALDVSRSMRARDMNGSSRSLRSRQELQAFFDQLAGDRVALIAFAGEAGVQCPLTNDYKALKQILAQTRPGLFAREGTSLDLALGLARQLLRSRKRRQSPGIIVLLSDGHLDSGADSPGQHLEAADAAARQRIRIFAVGLGQPHPPGQPIPLRTKGQGGSFYRSARTGQTILTRLHEEPLRAVAQRTMGQYFHVNGVGFGLRAIAQQIGQLRQADLENRLHLQYIDRFPLFLLAALLLLALAYGLPEHRLEPTEPLGERRERLGERREPLVQGSGRLVQGSGPLGTNREQPGEKK